MAEVDVQLRDQPIGSGSLCRRILGALPGWFGVEESVEDYVTVAERSPTVIACLDSEDVGFMTLVHHSPYASEVYVMGILPDHHRRGIGRKMLEHAEGSLQRAGVEFLQVKTLSPRQADEGYENTRAFYWPTGSVHSKSSLRSGARKAQHCS